MKKGLSSGMITFISIISMVIFTIIIYACIIMYVGIVFSSKMIIGATYTKNMDIYEITYLKGDVFIPKTVSRLEIVTYKFRNEAISISVDPENEVYYSEGNCVIERETNEIVIGCSNSIIPQSVKSIDRSAFFNLLRTDLIYLRYMGTVEDWMKINFYGYNIAYYFNDVLLYNEFTGTFESIEKIEFSDEVTEIPNQAFVNFKSLKEIVITENIKYIGSNAFEYCESLKELYIPETVLSINEGALANCYNLEKLTLPYMWSVKGTGYDGYLDYIFGIKSNGRLDYSLETVLVLGGTEIPECAFMYWNDICTIEILGDTKSIGKCAFYYCDSLKILKINSSVESIASMAFINVELDSLYYDGTYSQWSEITFENNTANPTLCTKNIYVKNNN